MTTYSAALDQCPERGRSEAGAMRHHLAWLVCLLMACLIVAIVTAQAMVSQGTARPGIPLSPQVGAIPLPRPVEGVDFARVSSTDFVFASPPDRARWLVTTIEKDASIRMWDFFDEADRCAVGTGVERIFIQSADDGTMSYPLEVPDPVEYVQILEWDAKQATQRGAAD